MDSLLRYHFSASYEFKPDSNVYIFRPAITYYTKGNHAIFAGFNFPISTIGQYVYENWGYRFGVVYLLPKYRNKRIEHFFEFEFTHCQFKYKTSSYIYAPPNATLSVSFSHDHKFSDATLYYGARIRFLKRLYFAGLFGFRLTWLNQIDSDSDNYYYYNLNHNEDDSPKSKRLGFTGAFELGIFLF